MKGGYRPPTRSNTARPRNRSGHAPGTGFFARAERTEARRMSVYATVAVPPAAFVLERALKGADLRVELERVVPIGGRAGLRVRTHADTPAVRSAVRSDPDVERVAPAGTPDGGLLLDVEWPRSPCALAESLADTGSGCLRAVGADGAWRLTVRSPTSERLAEFYRGCSGVGVSLCSVRRSGHPDGHGLSFRLSDPQHETLRAALDEGYFSVPREVTLRELADGLDVSDTAASQRLRRGTRTILAELFPP